MSGTYAAPPLSMFKALIYIVVTAGTLLLLPYVIEGISISGWYTAFIVALIWGLFSITVRPILSLLTLPINFLTLGLFSFVLNALLFWFVALLVPTFSVSGFIPALEGSIILLVVSWILHAAL